MNIESVKVEGVQYNVAQASAVQQQELMSIIGHSITALIANGDGVEITDHHKITVLSGLGFSTIQQVAKIVLYKTIKDGGDAVVSIDDFQGRIDEYSLLIFEAVRANLQGFFTRLLNVRKEEIQSAKQLLLTQK